MKIDSLKAFKEMQIQSKKWLSRIYRHTFPLLTTRELTYFENRDLVLLTFFGKYIFMSKRKNTNSLSSGIV